MIAQRSLQPGNIHNSRYDLVLDAEMRGCAHIFPRDFDDEILQGSSTLAAGLENHNCSNLGR